MDADPTLPKSKQTWYTKNKNPRTAKNRTIQRTTVLRSLDDRECRFVQSAIGRFWPPGRGRRTAGVRRTGPLRNFSGINRLSDFGLSLLPLQVVGARSAAEGDGRSADQDQERADRRQARTGRQQAKPKLSKAKTLNRLRWARGIGSIVGEILVILIHDDAFLKLVNLRRDES